MACYLVLLIVGGTSIKTSSVVYENSERDRIGNLYLFIRSVLFVSRISGYR